MVLLVAERRSGCVFDCRARRRSPRPLGFFDRRFSAIAVDVHLEDGRVMDEPVDGGEGHGLIGKDFSPFAERLICGDEQRASFVACADEFEEDAGFRLILGDMGKIVEDEQMIFVELVDRRFEGEVAPRDLRFLHEVGGAGEVHAPAVFDEREAERRGEVRLVGAGWPKQQQIGALFEPGVASGERLGDHWHGVEVEGVQALAGWRPRFGEMTGEAALASVGDLLLGERGEEARGGPALLVGGGGERAPDEPDAGEPRFAEHEVDARGVTGVAPPHEFVDEAPPGGKVVEVARSAQQKLVFERPLDVTVSAFDRAVLVRDAQIVAGRRHVVMGAQRLVAARQGGEMGRVTISRDELRRT